MSSAVPGAVSACAHPEPLTVYRKQRHRAAMAALQTPLYGTYANNPHQITE